MPHRLISIYSKDMLSKLFAKPGFYKSQIKSIPFWHSWLLWCDSFCNLGFHGHLGKDTYNTQLSYSLSLTELKHSTQANQPTAWNNHCSWAKSLTNQTEVVYLCQPRHTAALVEEIVELKRLTHHDFSHHRKNNKKTTNVKSTLTVWSDKPEGDTMTSTSEHLV